MTVPDSLSATFEVRPPYALRRSLTMHRMGGFDPTFRLSEQEVWRTARLPTGPATLHVVRSAPDELQARAWGAGAEQMLDTAPAFLGLHDDPRLFEPEHEGLLRLHRRALGLRLGRLPDPMQPLIQAILGQRVRWQDASASYRGLVEAFGEPAPGPNPALWVLPEPRRLARLPPHAYAGHGVEQQRARVIVRVCQSHRRVQELTTMTPEAAQDRLRAFPGVGPWTQSMVSAHGLGHPDTVVVGDLKLPHLVTWALTGALSGDDETMLSLLEPFRPHRWRVIRLLWDAGLRPPRRAPRARLGPSPGYRVKR